MVLTRKGTGKNKGNAFERQISKELSLWISGGERDDIFWRSDSSGARFTQRMINNKMTENAVGDISYRDEQGKILLNRYIIELKRGYNDVKLLSIIWKDDDILHNWIRKLEVEMKNSGKKEFLLIWKQDRKPIVVIVNGITWERLFTQGNFLHFSLEGKDYYCFKLEELLNIVAGDVM